MPPVLPNYADQAISETFDRLVSLAMQTGKFDAVNQHESKSAPSGVLCSVWVDTLKPPPGGSGIAATSLLVIFDMRVYTSFTSQPFDYIDPGITSGVVTLMAALSGDFDFGGIGNARAIDLLGMAGTPLSAQAGYVEIDRRLFRVMTITVPIIFNDAFTQEG